MMLGLLFLLFFVAVFSLRFGSNVSVVKADQKIGEIQYKVIEIQRGDSLWSIAEENMTPGFSDIPTYINEIKRCNQLDSDRITSGHYLMIPYYDAV
ncbi:MAG: LysM peptidoglycan-binding domain-containing protein [Eubacteriales bacterium]|nr:LysM peptidoglycan-binding domain-containing protein [Eubacteriales bacterium]